MFRSLRLPFALVALLALAAMPARVVAETGPTAPVEALHSTLLQVMRDAERLGVRGRYDILKPVVERSFNFVKMSRITSGAAWRAADGSERDALTAAFTHFSIGTYVSQFDGYDGQEFRMLEQATGPGKTVLVKTKLIDPKGDDVALTYVMHPGDNGWQIIDVLAAASISELARRRSEYRAILKSGGLRGLTATLHDKAAQLLAE